VNDEPVSGDLSFQGAKPCWNGTPAALTPPRSVADADGTIHLMVAGQALRFAKPDHAAGAEAAAGDGAIRAPMNGKVVGLTVSDGDVVEKGDMLFAVEAMKMEHAIVAPCDGTVGSLAIALGDQVDSRAVVMTVSKSA
ncbi:MAG: acetyl-CoA carboxylase biotin carboxyl carrier protein subunit, partial [Pseudomonadota bacterium]